MIFKRVLDESISFLINETKCMKGKSYHFFYLKKNPHKEQISYFSLVYPDEKIESFQIRRFYSITHLVIFRKEMPKHIVPTARPGKITFLISV